MVVWELMMMRLLYNPLARTREIECERKRDCEYAACAVCVSEPRVPYV